MSRVRPTLNNPIFLLCVVLPLALLAQYLYLNDFSIPIDRRLSLRRRHSLRDRPPFRHYFVGKHDGWAIGLFHSARRPELDGSR